MKRVCVLVMLTWVVSACVGAGTGQVPHEDTPGAARPDAGPALCKDGTPPPCPAR